MFVRLHDCDPPAHIVSACTEAVEIVSPQVFSVCSELEAVGPITWTEPSTGLPRNLRLLAKMNPLQKEEKKKTSSKTRTSKRPAISSADRSIGESLKGEQFLKWLYDRFKHGLHVPEYLRRKETAEIDWQE